jgi:hypothetical protein
MVLSLKNKTKQVALFPSRCQEQRSTLSIGTMHIAYLQEKVRGKSYKLKLDVNISIWNTDTAARWLFRHNLLYYLVQITSRTRDYWSEVTMTAIFHDVLLFFHLNRFLYLFFSVTVIQDHKSISTVSFVVLLESSCTYIILSVATWIHPFYLHISVGYCCMQRPLTTCPQSSANSFICKHATTCLLPFYWPAFINST